MPRIASLAAYSLLLLSLIGLPNLWPAPARAAGAVWCVSIGRERTTAPCTNPLAFQNISVAIGATAPGDEIRLAGGLYQGDFPALFTLTDTVLTISGGFSPTNWQTADPANVTILDGRNSHPVISITGASLYLRDLIIANGAINGQSGGGIRAEQNLNHVVVLERVQLLNNTSSQSGGGAFVLGPLISIDSVVRGNRAGEDGAGLWAASIEVSGGLFADNVAERSGGALNTATYIEDATFTNNEARRGGGGALILNEGAALEVQRSRFIGNRSGDDGGAIHRAFNFSGNILIADSLFEGNRAAMFPDDDTRRFQRGGAIFLDSYVEPREVTVLRSQFLNNSAGGGGGAMFGSPGVVTIRDSLFRGNTAVESGGALASLSSLTIERTQFFNNAGAAGGAIFRDYEEVSPVDLTGRPMTISDARFEGNRATVRHGGALMARGDITLRNTLIRANTAVGGGGALYQAGDSFASSGNALTMIDSRMVNNRAGDRGGAMVTNGTVQIRSSEISNNTAENGPGAIEYTLVAQDNRVLRMQGVLLSDNRSDAGAPVIRAEAPELSLQNVTLAAATADPSAAIELKELIEPSTTTLRNVILANYAVGVVRPRESTIQGDSNALFNVSVEDRFNGADQALPGANIFRTDPLFIAAARGDYRLQAASPLIDQGDPALNYSGQRDYRGVRLPYGPRADIGGVEAFPVRSTVYLPLVRGPVFGE